MKEGQLSAFLEKFLNAFERVFDGDWEYTKEMLGVHNETTEQAENAKAAGLEPVHIIAPGGTFIHPKVADENEDWGNRGELLSAYRELKQLVGEAS